MHLRTSTHLLLLRSTRMGALALSLAACGAVSSQPTSTVTSTPTVAPIATAQLTPIPTSAPATSAPATPAPATPPPTEAPVVTSCQVASTEDARVTVTGPDAATACSQIAGTLTTATGLTWTVVPASSPIPEDDTRTLCMGKVGQSAYSVLDHPLLHIIGSAACDALGTPVTPAV